MARESLSVKLRQISRTPYFQIYHLDPTADMYENADIVFQIAETQMKKTGRLDNEVINAMEEAIEVLFRCHDFNETKRYIGTYSALVRHNELVENGLIGYN